MEPANILGMNTIWVNRNRKPRASEAVDTEIENISEIEV